MFKITRRRLGEPQQSTVAKTPVGAQLRQASLGCLSGGGGDMSSAVGTSNRQYTQLTPVTDRMDQGTIAHDWIPRDTRTMNKVARLVYLTDPVAGPAIDFYREVPFGPVNLGGIKDEKVIQFYLDALEAIQLERHLPFIAGDMLVDGRIILHMLLNESKGYWDEIICHDSDYIIVNPSPIVGAEPIIDLMVPSSYQQWALSPDPRIKRQREALHPRLVSLMAAGATIPLSPENTIFIPRKSSLNDGTGTSLVMRILPIVQIEWAYLQAELTGLRRKAAPWTVAKVGIDDKWEPTAEEMLEIQDTLNAAEEDPAGAKLVFRTGVELEQIGGHTELAKWLEQWSVLKEAKLQGLGMNEAFATGEASWSYLESMLSLGMERIRNFRQFIALEVIREGVLAPLARYHKFYKRSQAELDHRVRTSPTDDFNLDLPTVEWTRSLQPTADRDYLDIMEMMEEKGVPINIRKWAQAGSIDIDEQLEGAKADIELRKQIAKYKNAIKSVSGGGEEEEEGEAPRWGRFQVTDRVANLPVWRGGGEFMGVRRGEIERMAGYVEGEVNRRTWRKAAYRMKDDGWQVPKIRTFQYLLARAGVLNAPLSKKTIVGVREYLLKNANGSGVPDRETTNEIYWLNNQLNGYRGNGAGVRGTNAAAQNIAPWTKPATPYLLVGDGNKGKL